MNISISGLHLFVKIRGRYRSRSTHPPPTPYPTYTLLIRTSVSPFVVMSVGPHFRWSVRPSVRPFEISGAVQWDWWESKVGAVLVVVVVVIVIVSPDVTRIPFPSPDVIRDLLSSRDVTRFPFPSPDVIRFLFSSTDVTRLFLSLPGCNKIFLVSPRM